MSASLQKFAKQCKGYHVQFDWGELAFGSKKPINHLRATFIAAPRELSEQRLVQLVKKYLPLGNVVIGIAKEEYIDGFNGQPQFKTLKASTVSGIQSKIAASASKNKLYTLTYYQRETKFILDSFAFTRVLFINGSWKHSFHSTEAYYALARRGIPYSLVAPFCDEAEAKTYEHNANQAIKKGLVFPKATARQTETELIGLAGQAAVQSYDYTNQVGVVLAQPAKNGTYAYITSSFNKVVPYQTYALLHGGARDSNFSPPNDLNHYDTVHAEVELIVKAAQDHIDLTGTTMFINVLPCPTCARMLGQTGITEFVYSLDHSDGYALKMLQMCGKKIRRLV